MELFNTVLLILIVTSLYYLSRLLFFNIPKFKNTKDGRQLHLNLPPGTSGWPLIGESLDYLRAAKKGCPEKFISDRRRKYSSNIFKTSLLGENMALLCTAEGNKFLFSNENKLVKSWWPKNVERIYDNSGKTTTFEEATRLRTILSPFLKPDSLKNYIGIMDSMTKRHLKTCWGCNKGVIKAQPLVDKFSFTLACRLFLNIEDDSSETIAKLEDLIRHISLGFIALPINFPGTKFNRAIRASKKIKREVESMVRRRRIELLEKEETQTTKDVMSFLLEETYRDGQLMEDSDIAIKLYGLLVGAYDNIAATIVSIMSYMADMPRVYDAVFREQMEIANTKAPGELLNWGDIQKMNYSWNVACEALRLLPPIMGTFREAISDFMYDGFLIPKGWKLHWNAYATHKNPKYFPEPEKFEPSRFEGNGPVPFSYVPFGGGSRMCPGKEYARLKILVFMHNVVKNFKWEKVFPDEKMIMDPILLPAKGLPIRLYPHNEP